MNYLQTIFFLLFSFCFEYSIVIAHTIEPREEVISQVLQLGIAPPTHAPVRGTESEGPFSGLVIKDAFLLDGTGAPVQGPVNIIIEKDKIVSITGSGTGSLSGKAEKYGADTKIIDAKGKYVLPGFIDAHTHLGTPTHGITGSLTHPEYVLKLWLAHGITTVREVGALMGLNWTLEHKRRSEKGEIAAPRMVVHAMFPEKMESQEAARKWIRAVHKKGADGIKFIGTSPTVIEAALKEVQLLDMKTAYHHSQVSVTRINVLTSAR